MATNGTVLVTGAGGFIGGWVAESLHLQGTRVRAGIHRWSGAVRPARFPMDLALCDVLNREQIKDAMRGVTEVVHCAKGSNESIAPGTENMLDAALAGGVRRFVYLSSAEVYGNVIGIVDEQCPLQPPGMSYGGAKVAAEQLCWEYHARGLPVTVIRPSIVYGPFSRTWTVEMALRLQSGNWGIFRGRADGLCNMLYVSDLVAGILLILQEDSAVGKAFNLNGPETPTWNEYFQRLGAALGLPPLKVIEPGAASMRVSLMAPIRSAAKFARDRFEYPLKQLGARSRLAGEVLKSAERVIRTIPRPADFDLYGRKAFYTAKKAHDLLGFKPKFGVALGLELSIRWLEQLGLADAHGQG